MMSIDELITALSPVLPDDVAHIPPRLRELVKAITSGDENWYHAFYMTIPADLERDADIVLTDAAALLERQAREIRDHTAYTESLGILHERIEQLEAVLPDDVTEWIKSWRKSEKNYRALNWTGDADRCKATADMLERQALTSNYWKAEHLAGNERIEQLEARLAVVDCKHEWFAACGPNDEGIKTCRKCNYQPKPPAS